MKRFGVWLSALLILVMIGVVYAARKDEGKSTSRHQIADTVLTDADCVKCHPPQVAQVASKGGKHAQVGCLKCHEGHAPLLPKEKMIPSCAKCHRGEPHFTLENCLECHANPHTPLEINLEGGEYKKACITCHGEPGKQLEEVPSKHTEQACNTCHERHGYIPNCLDCHDPHVEGQEFGDCVSCHQAHKPTHIAYGANVPNYFCGACHDDIAELLRAGTTKHNKLACVFCHHSMHGVKLKCETCHGVPHAPDVLEGFDECLDCHMDPHDLVK